MKSRFQCKGMVLAVLAAGGVVFSAGAQLIGCRQIGDLVPGGAGSYPTNLTAYADALNFSAETPPLGRELWRYDGIDIVLVSNINDQVTDAGGGVFLGHDSNPSWLTVFNGALYFSAFDARRGGELWRFNGTNAVRVADINPDANDSIKASPNSSFPNQLTVLDNELFFSANGGGSKPNYELWKYDGTVTARVANIHPDSGNDFSSYPSGLAAFNGALYFMADDGSNGYELWKADSTNAVLLANINPGGGNSDSYPKYFTPFNGRLYFQAYNSTSGYELWSTDGTNTSIVANLNPGSGNSFPEFLTIFNNALYFRANDSTNGSELWRYDGGAVTLISNINLAGDAFPKNLTVFHDALYFAANDGVHGWELWQYDGTNASLVADVNPAGDAFPERLTVFGDALYFVATTPETGYEWWRYDGNGVSLAADANPGNGSSLPQFPVTHDSALYFSAAGDGLSNWELWTLWSAPFRITAIERVGNDVRLTWATLGGRTNIMQAAESPAGPYTNVSQPILIQGAGEAQTNHLELNVLEMSPARFYRVVQP